MKEIEKKFNKIILTEMGFSILYAILGLIFVLKSEMTVKVVGVLIGIFFILTGLIEIYTFLDKSKIRLFRTNIFIGILNIILGIIIILNPITTVTVLNIGLGIWILVEGISKFILFLNLKKIKDECSKIFLVSSLLLIFLGIILIIYPFSTIAVTKAVGIFIILYNILNLNDLVLLKRRGKYILKLFK
jgi:uncharacterized membrane protein HdeD (DUF308 family)